MPKMFKHPVPFTILFFLLMPFLALAQLSAFKANITAEKNSPHSFRLSIRLQPNERMAKGLGLRFSAHEQVFPERIVIDGKEMWLRMSKDIPRQANAVHWVYSDSTLKLRFNPQMVKPGTQWELYLHLSESAPNKGKIVMSLLPLNGLTSEGSVLQRATLPLPQNPQK